MRIIRTLFRSIPIYLSAVVLFSSNAVASQSANYKMVVDNLGSSGCPSASANFVATRVVIGDILLDDVRLYGAPVLSISVTPKLWSIGPVAINQTVTMTQAGKITVTNDGTDPATFILSLVNPPAWTASAYPDRDVYVMSGIFCNLGDVPQSDNFNRDSSVPEDDVISVQSRVATRTTFGYAQATADGMAVSSGGARSLYLQFKTPTATDETVEQNISLVVSCQSP